jgi:uncharacterized membrane protein YesL
MTAATHRRGSSIGPALRESTSDFYFNSWRLVPANLVWGLVLIGLLVAAAAWPPALALLPLLGIPLAGIYRLAALIARSEPASFSDFWSACRQFAVPATALAGGALIVAVVLVTNLLVGLQSAEPIGWFVGVSAFYGLLGLATYLVAAWPILVDTAHEALPVRRRLLLAGLVMIGKPLRTLALTALVGLILAVSTALLAVVVMVGVAFAALISARIILPTVDALEARLPEANRAP